MSSVKRLRWSEDEVLALPPGENDLFDRKSGPILNDREKLAKAISAFANSTGGHVIIGVEDDGRVTGVDRTRKGRETTREWLEKIVPSLVSHPIDDFRVHEVDRAAASLIPDGKVILVVDVGDSAIAPHQAAGSKIYYYRQAGNSVPAPHFYLEMLRNRLSYANLRIEVASINVGSSSTMGERFEQDIAFMFNVINQGRIAAYRWAVVIENIEYDKTAAGFYKWSDPTFNPTRCPSYITSDSTILPTLREEFGLTVRLLLPDRRSETFYEQVQALYESLSVTYRVVSEVSPGAAVTTSAADVVPLSGLWPMIAARS